jgi:hypothetical protein
MGKGAERAVPTRSPPRSPLHAVSPDQADAESPARPEIFIKQS